MIQIDKKHPAFSMKMEIMCLLPTLPLRAEWSSICSDLSIPRGALSNYLDQIGEGYRVSCMPGRRDMAVGVPMQSWERMDREATEYYETVYGKDED